MWAAHFFALYFIVSLFPGQPMAVWLVLAATLAALSAAAWIVRAMLRRQTDGRDDLAKWLRSLGLLGLGLSAVAIVYQALIILF